MGQVMGEALSTPFDLVLGRKTYDIFAAHWPHATDDAAKLVRAGLTRLGQDRSRSRPKNG